jgi:fructokinase
MAHSTVGEPGGLVIAVAGEALFDLVVTPDGQVDARLGGAGYNTVRTLARLGRPATFLQRLSGDGFGRLLRGRLDAEGVVLGVPEPTAAPSTLAVADLDLAGVASYSFYLNGTAAAGLTYTDLLAALPRDVTAVHTGCLALMLEPSGSAIEQLLLNDAPPGVLVMLDPNCRPGAVTDQAAYRARIGRIAARATVVKASVEDLGYLYPGASPAEATAALLAAGPALVLVTDGPRPAMACTADGVLTAEVPDVPVADTIGAGDAFGGGFLAWWTANGATIDDLKRPAPVAEALRAAVAVAALTCTRPGADPPTLAEARARGWWPPATGID